MRYALQPLDPQRCPVDYNVDRLPNGGQIRQGIEVNRAGRPLAFYFMTSDPEHTGYTFGGSSLDRIPADQIIHGFVEEIEGQRRGIPWAATSLWRLHMLGGYERAALTSARRGSSLGGFIEWEAGSGPEDRADLEDEELVLEGDSETFQELPEGARIKPFQSQYPTGDFLPFHKAMLRGAGAGMGVAYVSFANDLDGVNFSSIRQGVIDERDHWMDLQEWLIEVLVDRCYRKALKPALLMGLVTVKGRPLPAVNLDKYSEVFWQGRRWAWVDPLKDVNAEVVAKNNMLTAPSEIIRRRGEDPDTTWRTYASDIKSMRLAGVPEEYIMAAVFGIPPASASAENSPDEDDDGGADDENDDQMEG